ncbi:hypothetical protein PPERSA_06964 [Pseudocohnilembus persalinus]|uniref:Ubiquitin-like protease family profile domain-containing protein n=1 Tax=Pseudocohnilembus persalinus TaxID=266149 RepID=A0A0V0QZM0_PSEPJ|nr:hypothetical protein PPERSA_06964 [Pseudocohnilembus persalinus]|eukprot:KRX07349.1 hypothetical protein PPERSA_06964 [Pseudocohnilembus persalinus]
MEVEEQRHFKRVIIQRPVKTLKTAYASNLKRVEQNKSELENKGKTHQQIQEEVKTKLQNLKVPPVKKTVDYDRINYMNNRMEMDEDMYLQQENRQMIAGHQQIYDMMGFQQNQDEFLQRTDGRANLPYGVQGSNYYGMDDNWDRRNQNNQLNPENWHCNKQHKKIKNQKLWKDKPEIVRLKIKQLQEEMGKQILSQIVNNEFSALSQGREKKYQDIFQQIIQEIHKLSDDSIQKMQAEYDKDICHLISLNKKKLEKNKKQLIQTIDICNNTYQQWFNKACEKAKEKLNSQLDLGQYEEFIKQLFQQKMNQFKISLNNSTKEKQSYQEIQGFIIQDNGTRNIFNDQEILEKIKNSLKNSLNYYLTVGRISDDYKEIQNDIEDKFRRCLDLTVRLQENIRNLFNSFLEKTKLNYFQEKIKEAREHFKFKKYELISQNDKDNNFMICEFQKMQIKFQDLKLKSQNSSIFQDYDKVGFIINVDQHWVFMGVNNIDKSIIYFDSMQSNASDKGPQYIQSLKMMIQYENKNYQSQEGGYTDVLLKGPYQQNGFDCGIFVCRNMLLFQKTLNLTSFMN